MKIIRFLRKSFLGLFFLVAVLVISSAGWSATYYVDATNGDDPNAGTSEVAPWKTIAKVNSSDLQPGDFILFKRGETWHEQLEVPNSGAPGSPITFGAYGNGDRPTINGDNTRDKCIDSNGNAYLTFSDLHLLNSRGEAVSTAALHLIYSTNVTVSGLLVEYCGRACIQANEADGLIILDTEVSYSGQVTARSGSYIGSARNITIERSKFHHCESHGLYIDALDSNGGSINHIIDCEFYNNAGAGFQINTNNSGYVTGTGDSLVVYNLLYDNGKALNIMGADGITFAYNVIWGSTGTGAVDIYIGSDVDNGLYPTKNSKFYNNTVYATSGVKYCWRVGKNTSNNEVKNNIFYSQEGKYYARIQSDALSYDADYNCYYGGAKWWFEDDSTITTLSSWQTATSQDGNSIISDPRFVNTGDNEGHLQATSPCIDAGTEIGLSQDYTGTPVPQGSGVDIGAFEYYEEDPNPPPAPPTGLRIQ